MTKDQIKAVLAKHLSWLKNPSEGEGADLRGADLRDADLRGADLCGAHLRDADLRGANLCGAHLRDADLRDADLCGADLCGADLCDAHLRDADLRGADLRGADLRDADLRGADLCGAHLPKAPIVPHLDREIYARVKDGEHLRMGSWHTCEMTHCRGGWAVLLAGPAGKELEIANGTAVAATLIYHASTGRVPDFYATNEAALADLKKCAAKDKTP